jgi:16S rRNA processing protein RimM
MLGEKNSHTWVAVGVIQRPHGLRGFVRVKPLTDWPERFKKLSSVCSLQSDSVRQELRIEQVIVRSSDVFIKFRGIDDRAGAEALTGATLAIGRSECVSLPAGEFYAFEIIGLKVVNPQGENIGTLADIINYPAHDVWMIRNGNKEWLIPATQDFVKKVDVAAGVIVVDRIEEFEE